MLLPFDQIGSFKDAKDWPASQIDTRAVEAVRALDEKSELEPMFRSILADPNETPHGPAELVDIFTHKVTWHNEQLLSAFILKGKSFPMVRPKHVSHQVYRLEKIAGLQLAVFAAVGNVLDSAKEEFSSTAQRIEAHYCILDAVDIARLLVAYGFLCPRDGERISAGRCNLCGYSPTTRLTNVLQDEALKELELAHRLQQAAGLVVLPPGTGKTRVAALDAKRFGTNRLLYVAHSHEILDVAEKELGSVFGASAISRPRAGRDMRKPAVVNLCSIQLIQRNLDVVASWGCDYVVIDEFHHAAAASYRKLLNRVKGSFLLGLTATPFREDRQDILKLCGDNIIVQHELRTGVETGILCPYHYYGCFDDVDYSQIEQHGAHYTVHDLERSLIIPERDEAIVRKWQERAESLPTLAFCCSHRHAQRVAGNFRKYGVPAEVYLATTNRNRRDRLVGQLRTGKVRVLVTVDVLNEGVDIPFVECLLFLRPTESRRIFYQQLGRGLRRYVGKTRCLVIDFIGNFQNAYKVVEYHDLAPSEAVLSTATMGDPRSAKGTLNLPTGCSVEFDEKVVDIFARQALDPSKATRQNIGRILIYQYEKLAKQLGHVPSRREVDRNCLLGTNLYDLVFRGLPQLGVEVGKPWPVDDS